MKPLHCRAVAWILSGAAVFADPYVVWAQAGSSEEPSTEAAALVERGIALRRSGQDAPALPLFQKAEALNPGSTRIKVHLAATYHALGQWEEADRYLTEALRDTSDPYIQKHQATLASARRTIDGHIGRLKIIGGPRGTEVLLNGRSLGTLPIEQTVRVRAGIYTLEATLPGHYPVTRSVALSGGALVQESLELRPLVSAEPEPVHTEERQSVEGSDGPTWLPWTLGGLAVGAGAVTVAAWASRERHAERWNDNDACLGPSQTREQLCGSERRDGERAETYMWIAGGTTLALSAAALGTLWLGGREEQPEESAALRCGIGVGAVQCAGRF